MKRIIIIGGGVAGLGAAYKITRAASEGHDIHFVLLEKDKRLGGKIQTEIVPDPSEKGRFVIDGGPDCFLTEKPACHRIAKLAGIFDDELPTDDSRRRTWILSRGKLHQMPDGVMMFAPTKFVPFATTGLFSWPGKIRMAMDLFIPPKKVVPGELNDETLESFVVRRMGRECLDRLAEPLVGGVHASDPKQMSLAATFPRLLEMEQNYGSLLKAFIAVRHKVEEMRRKYPPKPGEKPRTFFTSFANGMQELTDRMADAAGRERIRTGMTVASLRRTRGAWSAQLSDGSVIEGDAVILATESWAAEPLIRPLDAAIADGLAAIPTSSSATVSIAFNEEEVGFDLNAFGVLCPLVEGRALMAATYSSTKWPGRAPKGKVLLRGFVGGPHNQQILKRSDEELVQIVHAEFREIVGLNPYAKPLFSRVFRWHLGMPQYTLGHLDRVSLIEDRSAHIPGLALAGGSYRGVGVPNCIESGERAVSKVLGEWGIDLAEDHTEEKRYY
ncbi:MAG TPA: protoporphyrinogen oxidase [Thermodesulfobacteriota bacterium]|jgi:oxygen-dependent protoporphyrinogen oxidase|nr:protoporphyrinogen oxidase [Thermodesulfobacteriota bacterium]